MVVKRNFFSLRRLNYQGISGKSRIISLGERGDIQFFMYIPTKCVNIILLKI